VKRAAPRQPRRNDHGNFELADRGSPFFSSRYNFSVVEEAGMTQKVIEVVGTSKESFAKAAEAAVKEAARTVRGIRWAHVDSFDMQLDGDKVLQYRAATKIYFDVEH
jgi:flavin-binding protein dodecin